jgi:radical SAM family RiPP maturation amino acid epimerase
MNAVRPGLDGARLHDIAHTKRFLERVEGDPGFRQAARQSATGLQALLDRERIELSASALQPFCDLLGPGCRTEATRQALQEDLRTQPLGLLWFAWQQHAMDRQRAAVLDSTPTGDRRVASWRRRRIQRARSECLRDSDLGIFPLFAFELSKGCSTQCWFCAWDPPKLEGYFPYTPENRRLWREILGVAWDLFGPGCRSAVCFHATEPADNPDYFAFLRDVRELAGVLPPTTTARPLKDLAWTRELLRLQDDRSPGFDRFSVLNLAALREIHATFSADELLQVSLAFQNRGALSRKVRSGRTFRFEERFDAEERFVQDERPGSIAPQGTIECTCGYVVNMIDRSIRLISPCFVSKRWPFGYVVHAEGTFRDAVEFRDFVLRSIDECMNEHLEAGDPISFREDLAYEPLADGFVLTSRYRDHRARGTPYLALLGELVRSGTFTTGEITDRLIREGMSGLDAVAWLDRLYAGGLLADDAAPPRIVATAHSCSVTGATANLPAGAAHRPS